MIKDDFIPFNRPSFSSREVDLVCTALSSGHLSGNGTFTKECHRFLKSALGTQRALLTTSGTAALEMCSLLLDCGPGDEVILPSFTFVSVANAFALRGAKPVFVDIRRDTLNLDENLLERAITPRTKAIVVMHYGGVSAEMDAITAIAQKHQVSLIEDNAHGLFGKYRGKNLGTLGAFGVLSFHETKNFTAGEGGALLLNRDNDIPRAEVIWEKGTNRSQMLRGQVDKYTWCDLGSSFQPSDLNASLLLGQLQAREEIQEKRKKIFHSYLKALAPWADRHGVQLPVVPPHCESAYHLFHLIMPSATARDRLIRFLGETNILSVFHYQPLHLSPMGRRWAGNDSECPVTVRTSECLTRLPFFNSMTDDQLSRVVERVLSFKP